MKNCYKDFCTGCGLCHDQQNVSFFTDSAGYDVPTSLSKEQAAFCDIVCPMGKNGIGHDHETSSLWGNYRAMYKGYSCDEDIRFRASSGGVTTTLAVYLLEKKLVAGPAVGLPLVPVSRQDPARAHRAQSAGPARHDDLHQPAHHHDPDGLRHVRPIVRLGHPPAVPSGGGLHLLDRRQRAGSAQLPPLGYAVPHVLHHHSLVYGHP